MIIPHCFKTYYNPIEIPRKGCPSLPTPTYQNSILPEGDRVRFVHNYTTMKLFHQTKTRQVKNSLPLDSIHHELEQAALMLQNSGSSNILVSKLSFDCLLTNSSGKEFRDYIHFDLKIPGTGTERNSVFSYDMIEQMYAGKANLYSSIKRLYHLGRDLVNNENHTHGHEPDYNPENSKHDQYIRHTEQLLVAYLALPEASKMILNRLRTTIRGKYPDASAVKVYNTGLHMHSTKTCCSPCEYTLIGLMNDRTESGFLHNFKKASLASSDVLKFEFPKKSLFRLLVTVTANQPDSDHKKQPLYSNTLLEARDIVPSYLIDVKSDSASTRIFSAFLGNSYDGKDLPSRASLVDKTVGISGSKATTGSSGTINRVSAARDEELNKATEALSLLHLSTV